VGETSRDRQREATRQRLYEAALGIFRRDGFRAARVDDITLVAGVSRTAFYFHFPTKEDVLTEMIAKTERPIAEAVKALPSNVQLEQVLDTVAEWMTRSWQDERLLVIDAMSVGLRLESQSFPDSKGVSVRGALAQRFEAAAQAGVLTDRQRPQLLADLYLLTCMASMAAWASESGRSLLDSLTVAGRLFLDGARRR
jgi:AcrR family transcriptional regulator